MRFFAVPIRILGLLVTAAFFLSMVNLPGCARSYGDRTQSAWLKSLRFPVHQTGAMTNSLEASAPYDGRVTTTVAGYLESPTINELSGMAVSRKRPDAYWAINDSGNMSELFAIGANGNHLATYRLPFQNRDWEDMASFNYNGQSWLLVADSGDNIRTRKVSTLHFLPEPVLPQVSGRIDDHRSVDIRYEDGPQNVESVAVSVREQLIFLVSKNSGIPRLYALPLEIINTVPASPVLAKLVGSLQPLSWTENDPWLEKKLASRFLLGATSMDISADDKLAVIGNYRHAYLYRRPSGQTWLQALRATPQIISTHRLSQSETVALSDDAKTLLIGSEGRYAPMLRVTSE